MMRTCARPSCSQPAVATLRFAYTSHEAVIDPLDLDEPPQTYDLCTTHADRTRPPHGWSLRDHRLEPALTGRPERELLPSTTELGGRDTVALLAAALNAAADRGAAARAGSSAAP